MATAFDNYAPFDGQSVFEDQWRAMQRRVSISGVVRNQGNELHVFGDSTGRQVKLDTGELWIESYAGQITSLKTIPIDPNTSGSTRLDLIVARADWGANQIVYDVIKGTPGGSAPLPTRNTSLWEIPLAIAKCVNGFSTLNAADVYDARQWGGPPIITNTDDFLLFGDRISTCSRYNVGGNSAVTNGLMYVSRLHSPGEQTVSQLRMLCSTLPVGGTTTVRIFRGARPDLLTTFVDPTTSTFLYGGSVDTVHSTAIPTTTFRTGETIAIAVFGAGTTTAASIITNAVTWSGGNAANFLNPSASTTVTSCFKSASSMPTSLNLLDGSWTLRDRVFWAALA
jgi:hypothetical protein